MCKYRISSQMEAIPLGGGQGAVYFDTENGNVHYLEDIDADVTQCFCEPRSIDEAVRMLINTFEGDPAVIDREARAFIAELLDKGLLVQAEE